MKNLLEVIGEVRRYLEQNGRISFRMLQRQFDLDEESLEELVDEIVDVQQVARREGTILVWAGASAPSPSDVTSVRATRTSTPTQRPAEKAEARGTETHGADARKVVTIIFADLIGSTSLHERLDAESVSRLMERYYRAMRGAVEAHGGTVVKLMGDGVMAAFGVPRVAEDDASRAVRAGVAMQDAFRALARNEFAAVGAIGLRVGINTGEVVVSADNTDVVGDPVNVAARLQTEAHDGEVVIGESTRRLVAALVTLAPLGSFALKGRAETVKAYRVVSLERPAGVAAAAFVGRDEELARISAVYDAAVARPAARLAVLLGSPGLGKSRLIEEFIQRRGDAVSVLTAQCDAAGGATFAPLAEALRELLSAHRDQVPLLAKEGSGEVGQLAKQPPPSPLLGQEGEEGTSLRAALDAAVPGSDAERARIVAGITALLAGSPASPEETFFVIRRLLTGLATDKPIVLVIDDLQWAEPLLLDLVEHLVQWGSGVRLLVLVGARPELRDVRSSLVTPGGLVSDVITLSGLDAGAAMRLAANVIGAADLPAAVAAKVLATSEGNPLFVGELVRMLVDEGALERQGERWIVGANLAALEMPPTIHALLAARIERLRPEERTVLERAAVVGRHFSRSAVAALLGRKGSGSRAVALGEGSELDARLEALQRTQLIERDTGWFLGEPVLRFHHVLIRDAAYRRLLKGTRAELHEQLADWIEAQVKDAPRTPEASGGRAEHDETIGWHLEQAHQHRRELGPLDAQGKTLGERAAQRLAAAGRRALARDDLPLAAGLLGRAIDRLDSDDPARADLALDWCEALLAGGDVGTAGKAIDELGRFVVPLLSKEGLGEVVQPDRPPPNPLVGKEGEADRLRAWHTCFKGQLTVLTAPQGLQTAADAVASAAEELAKLGDAAGEAKAHSVHAQALARLGKVGACEAALDQALAAARRAGDRRRANAVLAGAPLAALWGPSPVTRASGRCLDVVRVLRITQGAPAVESVALSCQGLLEALRGRTEAARRMLASSRKMVEELGIAHRLFEADAFAGRIAAMEGDTAAAERLLRSAYEGLRDLGLGIDAARAGALLARTLLAQDRVAEAEALSHESERLAGDDLQAAIAWRGVRAEALAKRGEHAEAVELARAAVAIASTTDALLDHADARMALAAALRAAGRGTEADAEQRRAIELWEAKGATLPAERARRVDVQLPPAAAAPETRSAPGMRRRIASNRATEAHLRVEAGNTQDLFSEDYEEIDHPTGSTFGRDANFASFERLMRSRGATLRIDLLAGLGDSLALRRRLVHASATGSSRFDVGEYENERILVLEVDERGRFLRQEVFAANSLGEAITRLYARHAELLPDGPERSRAAATARSLGTMLKEARDLERVAAVIAPNFESVDHRHLSTWSMRGGAAFVEHLRALLEVAADVVIGTSELLALEPSALLIRRMHSGTERLGGGAYERPFLVLFATDAAGRLARAEWFDTEREAEALARFDEIAVGAAPKPPIRRRVRANTVTRQLDRVWAAIEARDVDALTALSAGIEVIHHPTGATYGATEVVALHRGLWRGANLKMKQEVLATLGDSLALVRRLASHDGVDAKFGSVGPVEVEYVGVSEIDERTQAKRSEIFAGDHLGEAIARLYKRYAELLPEGPERSRAAATARSVRVVAPGLAGGFDLDGYTEVFRSDVAIVDHRVLGWGSSIGPERLFRSMAAAQEVGDQLMSRPQDVLALTHDALLLRWLASGVGRESGGAFEWAFLRLFIFDPDGRVGRYELFGADREAQALARFDEIVGAGSLSAGAEPKPSVRRRVRANAATRSMERFESVLATRDGAALAEVFDESLHVVHHPTRATYGRREMLATWRSMMKADRLDFRSEILASLGDALALERHFLSIEGLSEADLAGFGRSDFDEVVLIEIDDRGRWVHVEIFAADRLSAAITRLYERYAERLPAGPSRERAAATARSVAGWNGPIDPDRLATTVTPSMELVDHRNLGTWSTRGAAEFLDHTRLQTQLATGFTGRTDGVLALAPDALLVRSTYFGIARDSGGAFENVLLQLFAFGADGLIARGELWEPDHDAQALARFDALTADADNAGTFPAGIQEGGVDSRQKIAGMTERSQPVRRRLRPSAASAAVSRLSAAFAARDAAAAEATLSDVVEAIDHRWHATYGREGVLKTWRGMMKPQDADIRIEPIARLGDRLSLERWCNTSSGAIAGQFDVGEYASEYARLTEVDPAGKAQRFEMFAIDHLGNAITRLYERYAELLPDGPERIRAAATARSVAVWCSPPDADRLATAMSPSVENADHRSLGTWSARGPEDYLEHWRLQAELAAGWALRDDDVLALEPDAFLVRRAYFGTVRSTGGAFENLVLALLVFGNDGLVTRTEIWEPDREAEALARFEEIVDGGHQPFVPSSGRLADALSLDTAPKDGAYSGRTDMLGPRIEGFANAASRTDAELFRCFNGRDWEGVLACVAPVMMFDERRRLARNTCDRDVWLEQFRFLFDVPKSHFTSHLRATRGERLALNFHRFTGEVAGGGGPLAIEDHFALHEVDGDGRIVGLVLFDLEDEDAAYAELDARFEAGEASAYPRLTGALATNRLLRARDWPAYAARLAPGFVYRDHRRLGWGDAGYDSETLIRILQSVFDLASDARYRADHIRITARGILRQQMLLGTRDGGAFENPMFFVAEVDEQGRAAANDTYDIEDRNRALARFAELGAPTRAEPHFENAASRAWREVIAVWRGRDLERFAALQPGLLRYRDHRRLFQLNLDREGFLEFTRPLLTMRSASAELDLLATRGQRLALMRFTLEMEDEVVGPSAIDSLLLIETDERGAIVAYDRYEIDDEDAARAEIQARFEELGAEPTPLAPFPAREGGSRSLPSLPASGRDRGRGPLAAIAKPTLATASLERGWAAFDTLNLDPTAEMPDAVRAHFAPDFVWEDRRPIVGLSGDLDLMLASMRERIASGAHHERRTIVGTAGDRIAIARVLWAGGPPDGRFEVEFLVVHEVNEAGLCTAHVFFEPDDERAAQREAWARWAAIDPVASQWVELVNEFTDAWNGHDRARVRTCFADDFVLEDHRHAGLGRIEGAEAYVDSIVVLWDLAPDQRLMFGWSWPVVERHGIVVTIRRQGTLPDGGPFESEHLALGLARNGRFTRIEFFEIDGLDTALARFEELRPDPPSAGLRRTGPPRIPPNAAT